MPKTQTPSLMDKLDANIDYNHLSIKEQAASVARDIQWLLNSKRSPLPLVGEAEVSILRYGIPDFSHYIVSSEKNQQAIQQSIKTAIERFEPRLKRVEVMLLKSEADADDDDVELTFMVNFRIRAMLMSEPESVLIEFESSLHPVQQTFSIQDLYEE